MHPDREDVAVVNASTILDGRLDPGARAPGEGADDRALLRKVPHGRRRVRVLHVIQNLNYGGMERLLAGIVHRLDPAVFESHVLVLQYLGRFAAGLERVATLHVAEPMPRTSMLWPAALIRQIRALAPDVVHTHSGVWYKASLAARAAGVPRIVHTDHGRQMPDPLPHRIVDRLASRRTDIVVAVSAALQEYMTNHVVTDPQRVRMVINGVDTDEFRPRTDTGSLRAELGLTDDVPILVSVGRLEPIKGYDVMIRAFFTLRQQSWAGESPVLVVSGDGSDRARLQHLIDSLELSDSVFLLGWRDDVHDLLSAGALFSMASHSEGTSVSLLEAMSAGLCPVVTDVGGNGAVLGEPLRHRLVPPGDPEALAAAWRQALSDRAGTARDGQEARQRVVTSFGLHSMVDSYTRLYLGDPAAGETFD